MKDNSRFVLAVHMLTLLAEKETALPSHVIARSAGVNAVTVRKLVGQLRTAGLVSSQTGARGGIALARQPARITLKETFLAVRDAHIFGAFPDVPDPDCTVGGNLQPALTHLLDDAVQTMIAALEPITIADVLNRVRLPA